jgi:hypothetical protein
LLSPTSASRLQGFSSCNSEIWVKFVFFLVMFIGLKNCNLKNTWSWVII